jgi:hypothetical protein
MKALRLGRMLAALGVAATLPAAPIYASDQALQAALLKLRCAPAKVVATELAIDVVSYEVTCKGRADAVFIVCQGADCRQQTKRLNHESEISPER